MIPYVSIKQIRALIRNIFPHVRRASWGQASPRAARRHGSYRLIPRYGSPLDDLEFRVIPASDDHLFTQDVRPALLARLLAEARISDRKPHNS